MNHTLVIMRHAHATAHTSDGDRERALNTRGRSQAAEAGQLLTGRGIDLVLTSNARRCVETFEAMRLTDAAGHPVRAERMAALYMAGPATIRQRIAEIPDEVRGLLVIGHAPGIPTLAAELTWPTSHRDADQLQCGFPTATFSAFSVDGSWADLADADFESVVPLTWSTSVQPPTDMNQEVVGQRHPQGEPR